ncbi:MAG: hypothetical protein LC732_03825 [Acidobacteria bacterium]|nr:hypothetical protein [Acidobacteriota bacterium]
MARIRVPIPNTVSDGTGSVYICFAEGHPRADGEIDVKLAFALKDESRFHRTPGVECQQPNEEALAHWATTLSVDHLAAALLRALSNRRELDATLRTRRRRV